MGKRKLFIASFLLVTILIVSLIGCSESELSTILSTAAAQAQETVVAEGRKYVETQAAHLRETAVARITQLTQSTPSPWDTSWLPTDTQYVSNKINVILSGTGMAGMGEAIVKYSLQYGVNPAFALAMFRKEASFARPGTLAYKNNNPGNIIATGECRGLPRGSKCKGRYGEISTDGRFGVYASMKDGIRAYFELLSNEYKPGKVHNCRDIRCIVTVYCPPSECDTETYISQITKWTRQYQEQILTP